MYQKNGKRAEDAKYRRPKIHQSMRNWGAVSWKEESPIWPSARRDQITHFFLGLRFEVAFLTNYT